MHNVGLDSMMLAELSTRIECILFYQELYRELLAFKSRIVFSE